MISHLNGFGKLSYNQLLPLAYRGVEAVITDLVMLAFHVGLMMVSLPEASRGGPMLKQCMIYAIMMYTEFPARNRPGHILRQTVQDVRRHISHINEAIGEKQTDDQSQIRIDLGLLSLRNCLA